MTDTYTDREGDRLTIQRDNVEPGAAAYVSSDPGAFVAVADLPTIVAELYKAAGQEPPIILPRYRPQDGMTRAGKVRAAIRPDGTDLDPADARHIACWYAAAADLAEVEAERQRAEAEQQKVTELAEVISSLDPWSRAEDVARAVLAAGYTRSES